MTQTNGTFGQNPEAAHNQVLSTGEAAQLCGLSTVHFRRLYHAGKTPKPIRLGERKLGWRIGLLIDWQRAREVA